MKNYFILFILYTTSIGILSNNEANIIVCTYYTPSHKELATEWLLPSIKDTVDIVVGTGPQVCPTAQFYTQGWTQTTLHKVLFIIHTIANHMGRIIVFADPDIIFLQPIEPIIRQLLIDKEFVVQQDTPKKMLCSGFFALIANEKTLKLWQGVADFIYKHPNICDQGALNYCLNRRINRYNISWAFLPTTHFCGGGTFKKREWKPGKKVIIPKTACMFHANFADYQHKIAYLAAVQHFFVGA